MTAFHGCLVQLLCCPSMSHYIHAVPVQKPCQCWETHPISPQQWWRWLSDTVLEDTAWSWSHEGLHVHTWWKLCARHGTLSSASLSLGHGLSPLEALGCNAFLSTIHLGSSSSKHSALFEAHPVNPCCFASGLFVPSLNCFSAGSPALPVVRLPHVYIRVLKDCGWVLFVFCFFFSRNTSEVTV